MPPISLHIWFSYNLSSKQGFNLPVYPFVLGNIAPDCIEPKDQKAFISSHFIHDKKIDLDDLVEKIKPLSQKPDDNFAFSIGYFTHLWLDFFDQNNRQLLKIKRPEQMDEKEFKTEIWKILNYFSKVPVENLYDKTFGIQYYPQLPFEVEGLKIDFISKTFINTVRNVHEQPPLQDLEILTKDNLKDYLTQAEKGLVNYCKEKDLRLFS